MHAGRVKTEINRAAAEYKLRGLGHIEDSDTEASEDEPVDVGGPPAAETKTPGGPTDSSTSRQLNFADSQDNMPSESESGINYFIYIK